jgi:hypothetical protein
MNDEPVIETIADGLRLQVGALPPDAVPTLLRDETAAYVVGFAVGVSRALDASVGNHTVRVLERGCRQGLPNDGDLGQRLADVATRLLMMNRLDDPTLAARKDTGEAEGRAFVEDRTPPSGLRDLLDATAE